MAIQPIDLQTLYSQMDKVSKNVVQQQQHVQLHNSMELDGLVKKDIQKNEKIEKTSEKEGMAEIKDGQSSKNSGQNPSNKNEKEEVPSTWSRAKKRNWKALRENSNYAVDEFRRGNFDLDKIKSRFIK